MRHRRPPAPCPRSRTRSGACRACRACPTRARARGAACPPRTSPRCAVRHVPRRSRVPCRGPGAPPRSADLRCGAGPRPHSAASAFLSVAGVSALRVCTDCPGRCGRGREGHDRTMNTSNGTRRLYRKPEGQIVAGVCTGLADYLGIDVTIVRLVFAALAIFGGAGVLLYVIAWAVVPEEGEKSSIVEGFVNKNRGG